MYPLLSIGTVMKGIPSATKALRLRLTKQLMLPYSFPGRARHSSQGFINYIRRAVTTLHFGKDKVGLEISLSIVYTPTDRFNNSSQVLRILWQPQQSIEIPTPLLCTKWSSLLEVNYMEPQLRSCLAAP